ncbi:Cyclic imide hydrolase [Klebsiella aerogenes]|nr:Cyclic imide hydrolase [Klebsiella aerogenes]
MAKEILCAFGVDVDAVAGWLGSYGGEISGYIHAACLPGSGAPRLLKLFAEQQLRTTGLFPGIR